MVRAWLFALLLLVRPPSDAIAAEPGQPAPGEELHWVLFLGSNPGPAGKVTYRVEPENEVVITLEIQDRGRGQKLASRYRFDSTGFPVHLEITGNDYWKNPVAERFELSAGKATWSHGTEKGETRISGPAYYYSLNGADQELGQLARALLRSPSQRLPLLPGGEASIERVTSTRVQRAGEARELTLYAIAGLGYAPVYLWMESQGVFFGRYDGFLTVVRQGWEGVVGELTKAQAAAVAERQKALAGRLGRRPGGPLAIQGARLFDPAAGTVISDALVLVSGSRIAAVGRAGEIPIPPGAEVIDAKGKMLLPGLWDMHRHFLGTDGILDLASGVTSGRDLGNDSDHLLTLKRRWEAGEALGPRIVLAGVIDGPGPFASPTKVLVATEEEARAAVASYAELGYRQIKIYSSLDPKLVPAIVAEAHRRGMRVSGHIPHGLQAEQAVRLGFDEVHHINFLFLNFLAGVDTRTPARVSAVAEHAGELDLAGEPVRALLRLLKERNVVVDPTVSAFEDRLLAQPGELSPSLVSVADRLPFPVRRRLLGGGLPVPGGMEQRYRDSFGAMLKLVRALHEAGIPLVAGTDGPPGFLYHRELENYVRAGIPTREVLKIATLGAARVAQRDAELGTIAAGKLADMILVDGDPTANISDIRRVVLTIKDGVLYDTAELCKAIGVKPVQ